MGCSRYKNLSCVPSIIRKLTDLSQGWEAVKAEPEEKVWKDGEDEEEEEIEKGKGSENPLFSALLPSLMQ